MARIFLRRQVGRGFTAETEVQDFGLDAVRQQPAFHIGDVFAALRDAVAEKNDAVNAAQAIRYLSRSRAHGNGQWLKQRQRQQAEDRKKTKWFDRHGDSVTYAANRNQKIIAGGTTGAKGMKPNQRSRQVMRALLKS